MQVLKILLVYLFTTTSVYAADEIASEAPTARETALCEQAILATHTDANLQKWSGKTVVFDTNVVLNDPFAIYKFPGAHIVISGILIKEVNKKKTDPELGYAARAFSRELIEILRRGGVGAVGQAIDLVKSPGTISLDQNSYKDLLRDSTLDPSENDNLLLATTLHYARERGHENVYIITDDINVQVGAFGLGLNNTGYDVHEVVQRPDNHTGVHELEISDADLHRYLVHGSMPIPDGLDIAPNEFVVFKSPSIPPGIETMGRFHYLREDPSTQLIHQLNYKRKNLIAGPRNPAQAQLFDVGGDPSIDLIFVVAPPGAGKTFGTLNLALEAKENKTYEEIIVGRPTVYFGGRNPGALPGGPNEKNLPWKIPFINNYNALKRIEFKNKVRSSTARFIREEALPKEISWLEYEYIRGISLDHALFIFDEGQNTTPAQIWDVLTRIGEGSRGMIIGDPGQIDEQLRFLNPANNGLSVAISVLTNPKLSLADRSRVAVVYLEKSERSELTEMIQRARKASTAKPQD